MSDESKSKDKTFEFPMMPVFGIDIGKELGAIDARLTQLESDNREVKRDIKEINGRVDKCVAAIIRLDERVKNLSTVTWGGMVVLLIAIIVQKVL